MSGVALRELALFAGAGGGLLGSHLLGWRTVAAVEIEDYPRRVLLQRQADGILPRFPIWDDVCTFDGKPWRGKIDVISGGFPCQDISSAGKGAGIAGERSGLWKEFARIISEVRPRYAFIENSPMLVTRGLDVVLSDLASMGFDAEWGVLSATDVGAPHLRERIWILAKQRNVFPHAEHERIRRGKQQQEGAQATNGDTNSHSESISTKHDEAQRMQGNDVAITRCKHGYERNTTRMDASEKERSSRSIHAESSGERFAEMADTDTTRCERYRYSTERRESQHAFSSVSSWWDSEPGMGRVVNGLVHRVDRLKAIGNGQVPLAMATAFQLLGERLDAKAKS